MEILMSNSFSATIDNKNLEKIFDLDKDTPNFEIEGTVKRIPKRKHKKRRIAKKWTKKDVTGIDLDNYRRNR